MKGKKHWQMVGGVCVCRGGGGGVSTALEVHCGTKNFRVTTRFQISTWHKSMSWHVMQFHFIFESIQDQMCNSRHKCTTRRSCSKKTKQTNKNPQVHNFLGQYDKLKLKVKKTRKHQEAPGNTSVESNCIERLWPIFIRRRLKLINMGQIKLHSKLQDWQKVLYVFSPFISFFFLVYMHLGSWWSRVQNHGPCLPKSNGWTQEEWHLIEKYIQLLFSSTEMPGKTV